MQKPRNVPDYQPDLTQASFSVLLELMTILEPYRDSLVLIGGWIPYLLLRDHGQIPDAPGTTLGVFKLDQDKLAGPEFQHIGSIDIDLVVDPKMVDSDAYADMIKRLKDSGYRPDEHKTFCLNRSLPGFPGEIGVDFLTVTPSSDSGGYSRRMREAGLESLMIVFAEMALKYWKRTKIEGTLPDSQKPAAIEIKIADIVAFYALKGGAFGDRQEGKDAYDIYYLTRYYGRGVEEVIEKLKPFLHEEGLRRGLEFLKQRFLSPIKPTESPGVNSISSFSLPASREEEQRLRRDVVVTMQTLLGGLSKED
jgi:hypothetical protein